MQQHGLPLIRSGGNLTRYETAACVSMQSDAARMQQHEWGCCMQHECSRFSVSIEIDTGVKYL